MSAITPHTEVYLLKNVPIELDNQHQLTFASAEAQATWFQSRPKLYLEDFSYQRKNGIIRVPQHIDTLLEYNYVMYKNDNYSDKWFYAFIVGMEYRNDNCTYIKIETDVWMTWMFDITWGQCFVEREHVVDDTAGNHTVPEGLEFGDYLCTKVDEQVFADPTKAYQEDGNCMVVFQVSTSRWGHAGGTGADAYVYFPSNPRPVYGGLPQGCQVFAVPLDYNSAATIATIVGVYDNAGKGNAINSIFLVPADVISWETAYGGGLVDSILFYYPSYTSSARIVTELPNFPVMKPTKLYGNYTPRNKKLLAAPYTYFYITNNAGSDISYKFEDFSGTYANFNMIAAFDMGGSVKLLPSNSLKTGGTMKNGWGEGVVGMKLPCLSWISDYYLNWKAVNAKNVAIQSGLAAAGLGANVLGGIAGSIFGSAQAANAADIRIGQLQDNVKAQENAIENLMYAPTSTAGTGSMLGSTMSFASQIANIAQQVRQAEMTPPQARGNTSSADLGFSYGKGAFTAYTMSIRQEYAVILDKYFDLYGYKVLATKVPELYSRVNWNYVKTVDCNIYGNIPQGDLDAIKAMFNKGITLWHDADHMRDYGRSNPIVS